MKWWLTQAKILWPAIALIVIAVTCLGLAAASTWVTIAVVLAASTTGFVLTERRRARRHHRVIEEAQRAETSKFVTLPGGGHIVQHPGETLGQAMERECRERDQRPDR